MGLRAEGAVSDGSAGFAVRVAVAIGPSRKRRVTEIGGGTVGPIVTRAEGAVSDGSAG